MTKCQRCWAILFSDFHSSQDKYVGEYVQEPNIHEGRKLSIDFIRIGINLRPNDVQRKEMINHISTYNLIIEMFSW